MYTFKHPPTDLGFYAYLLALGLCVGWKLLKLIQVINIYSVSGQVWILEEDGFKSVSIPEYIISGIMCNAFQRVS